MEKRDKLLMVFIVSLLVYEVLNRPILALEANHLNGTMEYQILFQSMFGCLMVAFIAVMELYRDVKKTLNTFTTEESYDNNEMV